MKINIRLGLMTGLVTLLLGSYSLTGQDCGGFVNPNMDNGPCPVASSQIGFTGWSQVTTSTVDGHCGCSVWQDAIFGPCPSFAGSSARYLGFANGDESPFELYREYLGQCLTTPWVAGQTYEISFDLYQSEGGNEEIAIFGYSGGVCPSLPTAAQGIPFLGGTLANTGPLCGVAGWVQLGAQVENIVAGTQQWTRMTFTLTPATDIAFIAIGGGCTTIGQNYFAIDNICVPQMPVAPPCTGSINLSTTNPASGASISYAYTNGAGVIQGVTSGASFTNVPEGAYNVYALQYETGSLPATWAVGQNISATTPDACNQVAGPSAVSICCTAACNDPLVVMTRLTEPGCPSNMLSTLRIKNGTEIIPAGAKITFYDGDPTVAGAVKLSTYTTTAAIAANATENIPNVNTGACSSTSGWIYAVLGDDGNNALPMNLTTGLNSNGGFDECDFTDNASGIKLKVRCGKYASMIQR